MIGQAGKITAVELVPGSGGVFEVTVGGTLVYSKKQTGRHAEPSEVLEAIGRVIGG